MASACINNVAVSQEFPAYRCFNPQASSFTHEDAWSSGSAASDMQKKIHPTASAEKPVDAGDFEFRLEGPVGMLPADELFSDGKLVTKQQHSTGTVETAGKCRRMEIEMEISSATDNCKAPRCSSRWREFLGLKRFSQNSKTTTTRFPSNQKSSTSSLKQFLHRSSRSSTSSSLDASLLSLPLLKDSDCESLSSSSSRMSLSSSSSGHDHEDIPRLSLDAERPNHILNHLNHNLTANPFAPARSQNPNAPRMRLVKPRESNNTAAGTGARIGRSPMRRSTDGEPSQSAMNRGVSVDSPRLNSSGKIVFQSLERSSSSPSRFNGGTSGYRHRGMERSYSANVRVTPVLNVPVCSIRGGSVIFGQFFSSSTSSSSSASSQYNRTGSGSNNRASSHHQHGGVSKDCNSTNRKIIQ